MDLFVNLVTNHICCCCYPGTQGDVRVLCNVLVSFLRSSQSGTLYGFGNIVGGVPIRSVSEDFSTTKSGRSSWGEEADIPDCIYCEVRLIVEGLYYGVLGLD